MYFSVTPRDFIEEHTQCGSQQINSTQNYQFMNICVLCIHIYMDCRAIDANYSPL